ncbi:MAG: hypothetical protein ABW065_09515 [Solirubrobacterales bacterium]
MTAGANKLDRQLAASIRDVLKRPVGSERASGASGGGAACDVLRVLPLQWLERLGRSRLGALTSRHQQLRIERRDRSLRLTAPISLARGEDHQRRETEEGTTGENQDRPHRARFERMVEQ